MVYICTPDFSATCGAGCAFGPWAGSDLFGEPVPLEVTRFLLDPVARVDHIRLAGSEAMIYVIAGSGTASASPALDGERFALGTESVLWLSACDGLTADAGLDGMDLMVAETTGPAGQGRRDEVAGAGQRGVLGGRPPGLAPRRAFAAAELPHLASTRDTRDRLDLVTENVPVGARAIRADRIIYHPGDTAAAHYHTDCHHVFCVLAGSGLLYVGEEAHRLNAGDRALVSPGEVHWGENDRQEEFSFVEFWAPPPSQTVWTVAGDRCTWAPAN